MTLLFMDGFEIGDHALRYTQVGGSPSFPTGTNTRFNSGRAISGSAIGTLVGRSLTAAVTRAIVGAAYYPIGGSDTANLIELQGDGGAVTHIALRHMTTGALALYRGTTQIAITAANIAPMTVWHYLELSATISDTVGVAKARLNGTEVLSFTGDTRNAGTLQSIDTVNLRINATFVQRFDDLYICDDTGSAPLNDFLGDVRVYTSVPTGAGASTNFTPSVGSNWSCVDELPYSAVDFVSSSTGGAKDTYAMGDLPGGTSGVYAVQVASIAKKSDTGARTMQNVLRSGGTDYPDGVTKPLATSDASYLSMWTTNPAGGSWTVSAVNALEAGMVIA